jgi:hypothetical protein
MKRYYNATTKEWYTEGQSMTRRVENGVFSGIPSAEQLYDWGFREWIEPAPTPTQLLERAKANKIAELDAYDSSEEVNSFRVNIGNEAVTAWFTPEQRADYKNSIDAAELLGRDVVRPVINGIEIALPVSVAKTALAQIQLYANQCYGVTEKHKAAINALETVGEVEAYDFERLYPEKLIFNV